MKGIILACSEQSNTFETPVSIYPTIVYKIMKKHGLVTPSPARSTRRKWVRFERRFSNAMWHADRGIL